MRDIKIESMLNETKGNLFEFLVAQQIAKHYNLEASFLKSIGPEYFKKLVEYQTITQREHPLLLDRLALIAQDVFKKLQPHFAKTTIEQVSVIGKIALGSHDPRYSETDIYVKAANKEHFFSLKFNKANSLINTKSGGVKSFLKTYFTIFASAAKDQEDFNYYVELVFEEFARDLHQYFNIEYTELFQQWDKTGLPELPGELPHDAKELLYRLYRKLIIRLFEYLDSYHKLSSQRFSESLQSLIGQSQRDLISIICTHSMDHEGLPQIKDVMILQNKKWSPVDVLLKLPNGLTSYGEIEILNQFKLQLRIKPMNKFTHASYKINCAIGFL